MKPEKTIEITLIFISIVLGSVALYLTKVVLVPFVLSIFSYAVFSPLIKYLSARFKIPHILSVLIVFAGAALAGFLFVIAIINSVEKFIASANQYENSIQQLLSSLHELLPANYLSKEKAIEVAKQLPLLEFFQTLTGSILHIITDGLLVLVFTLFMVIGESSPTSSSNLIEEILKKVSQYVSYKLVLSSLTGFLIWLLMIFCGVELSTMFALLTMLLNFIPTVGFIISTILPLPIIFLQFGAGPAFFTVLIGSIIVQVIVGNILEPKWLGDTMDLHPVTILICLMFWGLIWGIAGMFLAVPITATVKIIFSRIPATRGFSELLAGRLS